ncbi:hypothetical protein GS504_01505 [Rhodococcus hoagii]|nr:hypothetical protein [Prescottella equi]NKS71650.1 hypothetical protein [Prescottella equi]
MEHPRGSGITSPRSALRWTLAWAATARRSLLPAPDPTLTSAPSPRSGEGLIRSPHTGTGWTSVTGQQFIEEAASRRGENVGFAVQDPAKFRTPFYGQSGWYR